MRERIIGLSLLIQVCNICYSQSDNSNSEDNTLKIGRNIQISSSFQDLPVVEPHIAAHPMDNDVLLVAVMIVTNPSNPYQSCRLSSFYSEDGGLNWEETMHDYWGYDPWVAISESGKTVMTWLGTESSFKHQFPVQIFNSNNAGKRWERNTQTIFADHGHDGTKLAVHKENFYFTTVRFRSNMGADVVLYERTKEQPFKEVAKVNGQGVRLNFCEPAVLSDGSVVVPSSHHLRRAWVQSFEPSKRGFGPRSTITENGGGGRGYMRMASDLGDNSPFKDRLYFVRAAGAGDSRGVWLNYSSDKGRAWSADIKVDEFEGTLPSRASVASVAVNSEGILAISWVDRQENENENDVYITISKDGGQSFQKPSRVSSRGSNPKTVTNSDVANKFSGGGHYLGLTARKDNSFQLVWSDSRSGFFQLQTCNVSVLNRTDSTK